MRQKTAELKLLPSMLLSRAIGHSNTGNPSALEARRIPGIVTRFIGPSYVIATQGNLVLRGDLDLNDWEPLTRIPGFALFQGEFGRRVLRKGIRAFRWLNNGGFVAFANRACWFWNLGDSEPRRIGNVRVGRGPLAQGHCEDPAGILYYGEYVGVGRTARKISILCWRKDWSDWRIFYAFRQGETRHIHCVQYDLVSDRLWVATGDKDTECMIGYFEQCANGPKFVIVGRGSQAFRAVSLIFTRDYVYWGSDCGRDTTEGCNFIYRWSRSIGQVEQIARIPGPVYYSTVGKDGTLWCSSAVEGSSSEPDDYARLWRSRDGISWGAVAEWRKDRYPKVLGYGILSFPQGTAPAGRLYVNSSGIEGGRSTWILNLKQ